jgi:uncharacterized protein YjdB/ketosteroid isomerase-like protein
VSDARNQPVRGTPVRWTSSNEAVARVDGGGTVQAVGPGASRITATAAGISGTHAITVAEAAVARLTLGSTAVELTVGDAQAITLQVRDANGGVLQGRQVSWRSSNDGVATASPAGVISAAAEGTATITATSEGVSAEAGVTVRIPTRAAIERFVAAYARALESRDVEQVRAVYPEMTSQRSQQLSDALRDMNQLQVATVIDSLQEQGATAIATVSATYRFRGGGRPQVLPVPLTFTFARTPTSWRVTSIQ